MTDLSPRTLLDRRDLTGRRSAGFTLTEVVIALGIMVFVVGTVVSVLPYALQTHRDTNYETVLAGIVQDLSREIEQVPFQTAQVGGEDLEDYDDRLFYYDYEGFATEDMDKAVFQLLVEIDDVHLGLDDNDEPLDVEAVLQRGTTPNETQMVILKSAVFHVLPAPPGANPAGPEEIKEDSRTKTFHVIINDKGGDTA